MTLLRAPSPRVFGAAPVLARLAQAAIVAGTAWALQEYQRRVWEAEKDDARQWNTTDAVFRRVDARTLTDQQLKQYLTYLNNQPTNPSEINILGAKGADYDYNPLTGVGIYRPELERELLRRSNRGGFLFIPSPRYEVGGSPLDGLDLLFKVGSGILVAAEITKLYGSRLAESIGDLWGWLNSKPNTSGPISMGDEEYILDSHVSQGFVSGTVPPANNTTPGTLTVTRAAGISKTFGLTNPCRSFGNYNNVSTNTWTFVNVIRAEPYFTAGPCGLRELGFKYRLQGSSTIERTELLASTTNGWEIFTGGYTYSWSGPNPVPVVGPTNEPIPYPEGFFQPEIVPEPAPLPQLPSAPRPQPITTPEPLPETEPSRRLPPGPTVVPVEPGVPPAPRPRTPIPIIPWPKQPFNPQDIDIDGNPAPTPKPEPAPTPTNQRRIGNVTITSTQPRPDNRGIALEVGFLESKLDNLLNPAPGLGVPWLQILEALANLVSIQTSGDTWTLTEACPQQGEDPEVYEWEVPGVPVLNQGVAARLDALAEMLQVHKNLKQPVCKTVPMGQPVQVQFVQNEASWEPPP